MAGCTTSRPASVAGAAAAINLDGLAGAQGHTVADQNQIDRTMARGCRIDAASRAACSRHTEASQERRGELEEGS